MTDAIRLNGKKRWNGETVEFTIAEVSFINQRCGDWWIEQGGGVHVIDPATIQLADDPQQVACPNCGHDVLDYFEDGSYECPDCELYIAPEKPADDPRKAMLEEIRERVDKFRYWTNYEGSVDFLISRTLLGMLLDEMEAEL